MFLLMGFLTGLLMFTGVLIILIVLIQKGKSSMGIGGLGGGSQMLFGGSGGQDLFQKTTWVLGTMFVFGSLGVSIMKTKIAGRPEYQAQERISQTRR